jgi:hypothetical protein
LFEKDSHAVHVALFAQAAGCFWKNIDILEAYGYVPDLLQNITTQSSRLVLPHIEPWIESFFPMDTHGPEVMRLSFFPETELEIIFSSHFDITWGSNRHHAIGIVDSVSVPELFLTRPGLRSLAEVDIRESPAEQWWVFLPLSCTTEDPELAWILVNYEEQRMYVGPNATTALVWKGRAICDMSTWARLTTLDEIRDYGAD